MKKLFIALIVTGFSGVALAEAGLNEAVTRAANSVNIERVAQAVLCGETLNDNHCGFTEFGLSARTKYNSVISTLEEALYATEVYSESELERISKALENLRDNDEPIRGPW